LSELNDGSLIHEPVMVAEVIEHLAPGRGGVFVDCTVGLGGHTRALIAAGATRVVGIDRDQEALAQARARLSDVGDRVALVHADYRRFDDVLKERGIESVAGMLADLGVSSLQLDAPGRGFSFRRDEPLDMRMDTSTGQTAAEMLASVEEKTLADIVYEFGEERHSRRVARAIVESRRTQPIATTGQLAHIVRRAIPRQGYTRIDPATRTFQAIRIWVNQELEGLDRFLSRAAEHLAPGGRLVLLTFHSLEDRVVKHTLRALHAAGTIVIRTKRPQVPSESEIDRNPRARSAKLRAAERPA
jgi:16S rRNA (cytosine1402-N4)-methyltransferase